MNEYENEEVEVDTDESPSSNTYVAPEDWSEDDRNIFDAQSDEAKEFLLRRHADMQKGFFQKSESLSQSKRYHDEMSNLLEPYRNDFAANGLDDVGAIRSVMAMYGALKENPQEAIKTLSQTFGYQPETENYDSYDDYVDPAVQNELSSLKSQLQQQTQTLNQFQQQQLANQFNSYATATDDSGNLKYPYFSDAKDKIQQLYSIGAASSLEDAYRMVMSVSPELQEKQAQLLKSSEQARKIREAEKAKKAAQGVRSSSTGTQSQDMSLHDEISMLVNKQMSGG